MKSYKIIINKCLSKYITAFNEDEALSIGKGISAKLREEGWLVYDLEVKENNYE